MRRVDFHVRDDAADRARARCIRTNAVLDAEKEREQLTDDDIQRWTAIVRELRRRLQIKHIAGKMLHFMP